MNQIVIFLIKFYQKNLRDFLGTTGSCRYHPNCSEYAAEAYHKYSFVKASLLSAKRIIKCNPFSSPAIDPVPDKF